MFDGRPLTPRPPFSPSLWRVSQGERGSFLREIVFRMWATHRLAPTGLRCVGFGRQKGHPMIVACEGRATHRLAPTDFGIERRAG